ncbi:amidohydrolase family protein [Teichococcus oryzae]|uniref:Amidohydrolase family protein n=1 Tax=Teichococcus oryzae TaxID=1608942 RepID=A0A5B2TJK8_9PROT|nr:amidohydrolase family protein [Pseudoroseomonas oryzae]KAA2214672.1 amidohydrolase family protein [Pseudoroseomonas oryzae]
MMTRREGLFLAGALSVAAHGRAGNAATAMAPTVQTPVAFTPPPGSCDCHTHVFPDPARFPFWSGRAYTPPIATADHLLALQKAMGLDRVVIVQPSVYGTDNSATLDGMRQLGPKRARGVAVIGADTTPQVLDSMHAAGIRGIRVNLETGGVTDPAAAGRILDDALARIQGRPWHLQVYARLPLVAALQERLSALPMPVVFDHFAGAQAAQGVEQPGFAAVLGLVKAGRAYVKISGAYRASSEAPDYPAVAPLARALVAANPERIVWGTDWPHPDSATLAGRKPTDIAPPMPVDDGRVLNLLAEWVPDEAARRAILVDNPARLYDF